MEIKPDKKLLIKQWLILLTISLLILFIAIALQIILSLEEDVTASQVAIILWPITIGILLLMWGISAPIITLWIKNLSYYIEDDRITVFKGILTKQQQNIPYRAITDFVLRRSLYDRLIGIGAIRIQTAGQSRTPTGYEGQLSGLIQWENLHQQLRNRVKSLHPIAESTTVAEKQDQLHGDDKLQQILEELKAIRKLLENK